MKNYIIALVAVFSILPVHAQKEDHLQEVKRSGRYQNYNETKDNR